MILEQPDPVAKVYVSGNTQTPNKSAKGGTQEGVRGCQAPHPDEPHSGGRGGSSNVLTRVPLCQSQTQTTLTPRGGRQAVALMRLFQYKGLSEAASMHCTHSAESGAHQREGCRRRRCNLSWEKTLRTFCHSLFISSLFDC